MRDVCRIYSIDTAPRLAAFLAQTAHESQLYTKLSENLNYGQERLREVCLASKPGTRWRSLLPRVKELARNPVGLGNAAYGGRMGNAPEPSNDGYNYRGRGWIGNTGKANYEALTELLSQKLATAPDLVKHPELLEQLHWAAMAAGAFWDDNRLNELADQGKLEAISTKVNGGGWGKAERRALYARAMKALA
jgi:putative chitinase